MQQNTNIEHINQIYDKIFKKILTLSGPAVINLINGLFDTDYPPDSRITYNWTEFVDRELKRVLADTIITVNETNPYHIEAQIENDNEIVFRVFDYVYKHAEQNKSFTQKTVNCKLLFPEPKIIYLDSNSSTPDQYSLEIIFGSQGSFLYTVDTVKLNDISTSELNQKKMIILIPFKLLSLRKLISKKRTPENMKALQNLINNDILGNIRMNVEVGNISIADGIKLQEMTKKLYNHLYSQYKEMEDMDDMTDESIMLPVDILEKKYETMMAEKDSQIAEKDNEIAQLRKELEKLKNNK
ncbi:MAG: hypothetical protein ACI4D8_02970 [Wujia sp.]